MSASGPRIVVVGAFRKKNGDAVDLARRSHLCGMRVVILLRAHQFTWIGDGCDEYSVGNLGQLIEMLCG